MGAHLTAGATRIKTKTMTAESNRMSNQPCLNRLKPLAVTLKTARELLNIGNTKLYQLVNDGTIKTITIGRRRLAIYASLEKLVMPLEHARPCVRGATRRGS
jgi:excisionase family DNA binding protein